MPADTDTDIEPATLAWIRAELEDDEITLEDNFLELGGHSMMAIELNSWVKERYGVQIDVRQLFEDTLGKAIASATS